ncbi:MAG: MFS transporter [Burkholderiales bacterium]|nr:MFS transporter [Burkholderiales bacterium]
MLFTLKERKIVTLAAVGGMLEFYDFAIYGFYSVYFSPLFSPNNNHLISIIESFAVFILGYLARPIGGFVFSYIGDAFGRKTVLYITIILMGGSSLGIGFVPTYYQIGYIAPIILISLRLMQGLALGGELPSTYVFIYESLSKNKAIAFGLVMFGVNFGLLLGTIVNKIINMIFTSAQVHSFGWRIPFILGGVLCLFSYYIRKSLSETNDFIHIKHKIANPLLYMLKNYFGNFIATIGISSSMAAFVVVGIIFMPTYLKEIVKVDLSLINTIMTFALFVNTLSILLFGVLSNKIDKLKLFKFLLVIMAIIVPISFYLFYLKYYAVGVFLIATVQGGAAMLTPFIITSLFPTKIRLTGVALAYNISFTIFGGLSPVLISTFINMGDNIYITPFLYLEIIVLMICPLSLQFIKDVN